MCISHDDVRLSPAHTETADGTFSSISSPSSQRMESSGIKARRVDIFYIFPAHNLHKIFLSGCNTTAWSRPWPAGRRSPSCRSSPCCRAQCWRTGCPPDNMNQYSRYHPALTSNPRSAMDPRYLDI